MLQTLPEIMASKSDIEHYQILEIQALRHGGSPARLHFVLSVQQPNNTRGLTPSVSSKMISVASEIC
jgi:hypothetical protein